MIPFLHFTTALFEGNKLNYEALISLFVFCVPNRQIGFGCKIGASVLVVVLSLWFGKLHDFSHYSLSVLFLLLRYLVVFGKRSVAGGTALILTRSRFNSQWNGPTEKERERFYFWGLSKIKILLTGKRWCILCVDERTLWLRVWISVPGNQNRRACERNLFFTYVCIKCSTFQNRFLYLVVNLFHRPSRVCVCVLSGYLSILHFSRCFDGVFCFTFISIFIGFENRKG